MTNITWDYYKNLERTASFQELVSTIPVPALTYLPVAGIPMAPVENDVEVLFTSIVQLSGLTETETSERLIGVARQSATAWKRTGKARAKTIEKMIAIKSTLIEAEESLRSQGYSESLRVWLKTPRGDTGTTPLDLFDANQLASVKLLAMSAVPARRERAGSWMAGAPLSAETEQIGRILESTSEGDYRRTIAHRRKRD